jgi:hypothetical protein
MLGVGLLGKPLLDVLLYWALCVAKWLSCTHGQDHTIMAAADRFRANITGRGGHAAMPHLTTDPVVAGAQVVAALQPLVSRETSPTDSTVVTVSRFNTGARSPLELLQPCGPANCPLLREALGAAF